MTGAGRLYSAAAARNADAIRTAWAETLPVRGAVLEVASGTGQHASHLCAAFPGLAWRPSDPDADSRASITERAGDVEGGRLAAPLALDVTEPGWWQGIERPDVLYCANMIHIAPWAAAEGLFRGAGALLTDAERPGTLAIYGPFSRRGAMADGNACFHASLRERDPAWGVRDLDDDVQPLAARFGLALTSVRAMPANNLFVLFAPN